MTRFRQAATGGALVVTSRVAPRLAGRWAADLWCTVPASSAARSYPPGGTPFEVNYAGGAIRGQVWGHGPPVYLLHGWAGTGGQLSRLVEPLVGRGFRVVMFDGPSHGASGPGPSGMRRSNALEFSQALAAVAARHGKDAVAVVAHSMGALSTLLTLRSGGLGVRRLVFLAPMHDLRGMLDEFAGMLRLTPKARRWLEVTLERLTGRSVDDFNLLGLAPQAPPPLLVVHDRQDRRTSYAASVALAQTWPGATLVSTEGLGHRRVLDDADVATAVVEFVDPDDGGEAG